MKRSPIKRKPPKKRARGTGCMYGKRCIAAYSWEQDGETKRACAKHYADILFSLSIRKIGHCAAYGTAAGTLCKGNLQCAHIMSRRYIALRWDDRNAVPLCMAHHHWFTHRPADWEQWCRDNGIDWDELRRRALNDPPMQPVFVIERLAA